MRSTMQDAPLTIAAILRHGTTWHGDAVVATSTGDGVREVTFAELGERVARLAHGLRSLGIDGDQRVATFAWNNQEHLEAYLAVPSMGAVLHTLNIRLFPEQLVYVANHAEDTVVIVDASLAEGFSKLLPQLSTVKHVLVAGGPAEAVTAPAGVTVHGYDEVLAGGEPTYDWPEVDERDAAAMCYTSGTTGNPKGVAYSHRSSYLHSMAVLTTSGLGLRAEDRVLPIVPMFHANAWGLAYAAVMAGADLVMPDRWLQAEPLARLIAEQRPTLSGAVPTIWNDLRTYAGSHEVDLSSLRLVACGGSAVPTALMKYFEQEQGVVIQQAWGMTETSPLGSVARPPKHAPAEEEWHYRSTAGRVIAGVEVRVTADDDTVLPNDGESVGEIEVRGPWITASYYRDEDPAKFHDGWLRTGDVGHVDRYGFITLTDRAKDVIKSGGEWISSVDLENELMAHPDVLEAAVVGVPDEKWGERPLACVVPREGVDLDLAALREHLAATVARWQLPDRWAVVEAVPRTSVGKFDKKVLRKAYAEGEIAEQRVGSPG